MKNKPDNVGMGDNKAADVGKFMKIIANELTHLGSPREPLSYLVSLPKNVLAM